MKILFVFLCILLCPPLSAQEPEAELVLKAYQYAYPHQVKRIFFADGDWAVQIKEEVFYWAEGRLLPAALRGQWQNYRPHGFSRYPGEVPAPEAYTPGKIEELRRLGKAEARQEGPDPHYGFQAALYGGAARLEIERALRKIRFLNRELTVHRDITGALARIDRKIQEIAREDKETAAFIGSINSMGGYNWREIRGTRRMSYHSWGLAVDIQPAELNTRVIYWLWEHNRNDDWMLVPLRRRWQPPEAVIRAFENEGFIWGGKWTLYDNMHFEFRPELHEINRLLAAEKTAQRAALRAANSPKAQDLHHLFPQGFPPKGARSLWEGLRAFFHLF
jgi:hypothetical protein